MDDLDLFPPPTRIDATTEKVILDMYAKEAYKKKVEDEITCKHTWQRRRELLTIVILLVVIYAVIRTWVAPTFVQDIESRLLDYVVE